MPPRLRVSELENGSSSRRPLESVTSRGVEYSLHDCVITYQPGKAETYIGKIVRIMHSSEGIQLKIVWFFRPSEIRDYLGDYEPRWNEIFLASGRGDALSATFPLEAMLGKCTVVCISQDPRNCLPSKAELRNAEYIFSRAFDVGKLRISKKFPCAIDGVQVENFFNKRRGTVLELSSSPTYKLEVDSPAGCSESSSQQSLGIFVKKGCEKDEDKHLVTKEPVSLPKIRFVVPKPGFDSDDKIQETNSFGLVREVCKEKFSARFPSSSPVNQSSKKVRFSDDVKITVIEQKGKVSLEAPHSSVVTDEANNSNESSLLMVEPDQTTKMAYNAEKVRWLKEVVIPWQERLQDAQSRGTLVLLDNLDPTFSSSEVEDMVLSAFNERVAVKMITQTPFAYPLYGKAFLIFKSKDTATSVIKKVNSGCLMLRGQRPVLASIGTLEKSEESKLFVGHYKMKLKRLTEDMRNAVTNSHCSQENTISYRMGMEWRILQDKTERWWKQLRKIHTKEMMELKKQLKASL